MYKTRQSVLICLVATATNFLELKLNLGVKNEKMLHYSSKQRRVI